jgi:hypothetical protein
MLESNFLTVVGVLIFAAAMLYRVGFFNRKRWGHFTLLQVVYLVVVPGLIFPLLFSYMRSITMRPQNEVIILPDGFFINMILMASLFTYGGIAIHAVTKMLSEVIDEKADTEAAKMNYFFHQTFSHNLTYSGAVTVVLGLTLLDLNHLSNASYAIGESILRGVVLAVALLAAVFYYEPFTSSRWSDLKSFFLVLWLGFMGVIYGVRKVDPSITEYQLLLPALISFSVMSLLSFLLVLRRLKHGFRIYVSKKRVRRMMDMVEVR